MYVFNFSSSFSSFSSFNVDFALCLYFYFITIIIYI